MKTMTRNLDIIGLAASAREAQRPAARRGESRPAFEDTSARLDPRLVAYVPNGDGWTEAFDDEAA